MNEDEIKVLKRIWSMCLIKEDASETPYDTLGKIAGLVHKLILDNDVEFRKLYERMKKERVESEAWDENERFDLRNELDRDIQERLKS